jgi:hypothetical protein
VSGGGTTNALDQSKLSHTVTAIILLASLLGASSQSAPPLRIVVLQGEDAVNVIQQKSAVAPLVEVRDRNDLPVAGATVTFTIGGNAASFAGGVQTFTIATNAAGQAAAAAINPLASGAVQIQVAAAFQGQTAAATIVQTNVLTAAQAAGAAGASSAGASGGSTGGSTAAAGGAGGGGGISGSTVGIIGAAVGAGALAATQVAGNEADATSASGPREFRGTFTFDITLNFSGCTRLETWSGQVIIAVAGTEPLNGNAAINNGTTRVAAVTCSGGPQLGATGTFFMAATPLTGTAASLGFRSEQSNTFPPGPNEVGGVNTQSFAFTGVLNGAEITGTLAHTRRIDSNGSTVPGTGTASAAITLR